MGPRLAFVASGGQRVLNVALPTKRYCFYEDGVDITQA